MAEEVDPEDDEPIVQAGKLQRALAQIGEEIARVSAEEFAPIGWSGELRAGIFSEPPRLVDGEYLGRVASFAVSESGFNYAEKQHSAGEYEGKELRHVSRPPFESSFTDLAPAEFSGSPKEKYAAGYRKAVDEGNISDPFVNEYLVEAAEKVFNDGTVDKILGAIFE